MLLADMLKQKPLAIYMLGDVVAVGSSHRKWAAVDRFIDTCRKNNIAVHGLLGNHDLMWIVGSSAQVQRYFLPSFLQTVKCTLFITGHAHAFEHFRFSGKNFLVIGGGGGLHQPLDTSIGRIPDVAFDYKPMFHYLSVRRGGDRLLVTSHFVKEDFSGVEKGYFFEVKM